MYIHITNFVSHLFQVSLHLPSTIPMLQRQYFQVPLGNAVLAVIQPKVIMTSDSVKKFNPVDRECYFPMEKHLKYFNFYNPDNCKFECLTNYSLTKCGCVHFYMPSKDKICIYVLIRYVLL